MKTNFFCFLACLLFAGSTFAQPTYAGPILGSSAFCHDANGHTYSAFAMNGNISWSVFPPLPGVVINTPTNDTTTIVFPNMNHSYMVYFTVSNSSGASTSQMAVNVYETPDVTFSGATAFCEGSSTNLSASATIHSASSTLPGSSTLSYNWSPSAGLNPATGPSVTASPSVTTIYTVVTTLGPCSSSNTLAVIVDPCVGLATNFKEDAQDLLIYPNPSNGLFAIRPKKAGTVFIINDLGQTIKTISADPAYDTPVVGLAPGIYFIVTPTTRKKIIITGSN